MGSKRSKRCFGPLRVYENRGGGIVGVFDVVSSRLEGNAAAAQAAGVPGCTPTLAIRLHGCMGRRKKKKEVQAPEKDGLGC